MTTTSQTPPWVLSKAVLVYTPDFNVSCPARIRIVHDKSANQGSISLRITADLANLSGRSQVLMLNTPPERVEQCKLFRLSNDGLCPSRLISILPAPVTKVSAVSTLSLKLDTPGIVFCPSEVECLSPAKQEDLSFHAFAKICQSTYLHVHFSRRQFMDEELNKLETFSCALREKRLQTKTFDHARHGLVQKDWRAFSLSLDPPPYYEEPVSEQVKQADPPLYCESVSEQLVGKRRRAAWSMPPDDERRKRLLLSSPQPIGSPTEVNTPSTISQSPASIRPTYFMHASSPGHKEHNKLTRLEHELRGVSDDLICELLIRSGRQHLLALPRDVDNYLPSEFGKVGFAEIEMVERRLKRYIDDMIEHRLKSHVDEIVDSAVSECREQFLDECKTNEADFREQVEEGNSEVRITTNECMNELKEQAQKYMDEIEEQAQQYMDDIKNQGIEVEASANRKAAMIKRWFNAPARYLLDSRSSPSHELGISARRSSI